MRAKLGFVPKRMGLFVAWDCNLANVSDQEFRPLIAQFAEQMIVLTDTSLHGRTGDPANMKVRKRGMWNTRMMIEIVLSMLTTMCQLKHQRHWRVDCFRVPTAFVIAAFNLLAQ